MLNYIKVFKKEIDLDLHLQMSNLGLSPKILNVRKFSNVTVIEYEYINGENLKTVISWIKANRSEFLDRFLENLDLETKLDQLFSVTDKWQAKLKNIMLDYEGRIYFTNFNSVTHDANRKILKQIDECKAEEINTTRNMAKFVDRFICEKYQMIISGFSESRLISEQGKFHENIESNVEEGKH